jgi:hypothetical protein
MAQLDRLGECNGQRGHTWLLGDISNGEIQEGDICNCGRRVWHGAVFASAFEAALLEGREWGITYRSHGEGEGVRRAQEGDAQIGYGNPEIDWDAYEDASLG